MVSAARLIRDRRGATAIEFALVAPLLLLSILFIMVVAAVLYINQTLDYATSQAARQILTGTAQSGSMDQATFKANLCSNLPAVMPCANVIVNLYVVPQNTNPSGYYTFVKSDQSGLLIPPLTSGSGQYTLGGRGAYQYLQVIYPTTFLPRAFATMLSGGVTYNGAPAYLTIATAAFRNEQF